MLPEDLMIATVAWTLLGLSTFGIAALLFQLIHVCLHVRTRPKANLRSPEPVSILKPLCGLDEDLEANLECFATLPGPAYELLLGLKDANDPAYPVACGAARRWPRHVRVVLQQGEPGLNPKVNQLVTLARVAKYDLLAVSDSNVRVGPGYLREICALFEDSRVACVTHPVVGSGERSLGSLMDNLHLSSSAGAGQVAAKRAAGRDLVVGKSMVLRRQDLDALGGFDAFKDHLAEDYVLGQAVTRKLGKRVVVARGPVHNVARGRSVMDFFRRYSRWSVIHRTAIGSSTYFAQALLNPSPLAWMAVMTCPTQRMFVLAMLVTSTKAFIDVLCASLLRGARFGVRAVLATPLKDLLLFVTWVNGLYARTVSWRGNQLRVMAGSLLVAPETANSPTKPTRPLGDGSMQ
jgi:ceramide glucosyltransferase